MRLIDANAGEMVDAGDRGLAYGDGFFETLRVVEDHIPLLDWHLARVERSTAALRFGTPDLGRLAQHMLDFLKSYPGNDWLKLIVTRGTGARGYRALATDDTTVILSSGRLAGDPRATNTCLQLGLAANAAATVPGLSPLKHLSRLGEVQAAMHPHNVADEQLICDHYGALVCGIMGNLFVVRDALLQTPILDHQGVAGVMRDWVLAHSHVAIKRVTLEDAMLADEVFMTNAVRGVVSVGSVCKQSLPSSTPVADALRAQLVEIGFSAA